jgi:peptidoglycan DL-endopeptidase CwlO
VPGFRQIARSPFGHVLAIIIIAVLLVLSVPSSAQATPAIDKAKREAAALLKLIEELDDELGAAAEEYNYAKQRLDDIKVAAKRTSKELDQTEADLEEVQKRLNDRVVSIYKAGNPGMLDVLFDAASFSQMITRFNQLTRLGEQDAELLEKVQAYQAKMEDKKTKLEAQVREQKALTVELEAAKEKVEAQLKKQEKALKGKEALVAKLKKEEAARQARLAAEARARAAWLASRPGKVVSYAMQYLGVPYVWGGESPRGFDCSGLVKYVYAKVGISLPHSSRMQYNYGRYVSKSQVRAGDLVFFYNPIHHVGIYIGNGKMVDATGNKVQISNVFRASYFGAKRLL